MKKVAISIFSLIFVFGCMPSQNNSTNNSSNSNSSQTISILEAVGNYSINGNTASININSCDSGGVLTNKVVEQLNFIPNQKIIQEISDSNLVDTLNGGTSLLQSAWFNPNITNGVDSISWFLQNNIAYFNIANFCPSRDDSIGISQLGATFVNGGTPKTNGCKELVLAIINQNNNGMYAAHVAYSIQTNGNILANVTRSVNINSKVCLDTINYLNNPQQISQNQCSSNWSAYVNSIGNANATALGFSQWQDSSSQAHAIDGSNFDQCISQAIGDSSYSVLTGISLRKTRTAINHRAIH